MGLDQQKGKCCRKSDEHQLFDKWAIMGRVYVRMGFSLTADRLRVGVILGSHCRGGGGVIGKKKRKEKKNSKG